jgi:hypothetical protein
MATMKEKKKKQKRKKEYIWTMGFLLRLPCIGLPPRLGGKTFNYL